MSWRWTHNCLLLTKKLNLKKTLVPYGVMRNLDAIIRVSNYVSLNPGLQRARSLWSGVSDNLIYATLVKLHGGGRQQFFLHPL